MRIKKVIAILLSVLVIMSSTTYFELFSDYENIIVTKAYEGEKGVYGNLTYYITTLGEERYIEIYQCDTSAKGDLTIPAEIDGIPVTWIFNSAFWGCDQLTSITVPKTVTFIGYEAFYGCDNLETITFLCNEVKFDTTGSDEGRTIAENATIVGYEGSSAQSYAKKYGRKFKNLTTGEEEKYFSGTGVLAIGNYSQVNSEVTKIIIEGYTSISFSFSSYFRYCFPNLREIEVSGNNPTYCSEDGVLFNKDCSELILFPAARSGEYVIPNSVTSIGYEAFSGCRSLESITIPNSVTSIEKYAFSGCRNLESITIPNSVTSIENKAFSGCSSLKSVTIPDSVTSIGESAFSSCTSLKSVTIPDSVTSIENYAFSYCANLESIIIPDSVTRIRDYAFYNCTSLKSVTISNSVTAIPSHAFYGCTSLKSIVIPDSVTSIENHAFSNCANLESIIIPDSVTSIGSGAFYDTLFLEKNRAENQLIIVNNILLDGQLCDGDAVIPEDVTKIGSRAFLNSTSLKAVKLPESVTHILESAFYGCTSLESVTIPKGVGWISDYAFADCTNLESITILNPDCVIYSRASICSGYNEEFQPYFSGTIYGYSNSTAQEYAEIYGYNFVALDEEPETDILYGDANLDGKVSAADAVAILQSIGNSDKYGLSAQGKINADVDGTPGITPKDALVIQQVNAGIYQQSDLPLKA